MIRVRVAEDEKSRIESAALSRGLTVSGFIRDAVRQSLPDQQLESAKGQVGQGLSRVRRIGARPIRQEQTRGKERRRRKRRRGARPAARSAPFGNVEGWITISGEKSEEQPTSPVKRAGIDKLTMSLIGRTKPPWELPDRIGSYVRVKPAKRGVRSKQYQRFVQYVDTDDPGAPYVDIQHRPTPDFLFLPRALVILRSPILKLVTRSEFVPLVTLLEQTLGGSLRVSQVELTVDFDSSKVSVVQLQRVLSLGWVRRPNVDTGLIAGLYPDRRHYPDRAPLGEGTLTIGSKTSPTLARVYAKEEGRFVFSRVEVVANRSKLRGLGINTIEDLCDADPRRIVGRSIRFSEFIPRGGATLFALPEEFFAQFARLAGVQNLLWIVPSRDRQWIKRRLQPSTLGVAVLTALRTV